MKLESWLGRLHLAQGLPAGEEAVTEVGEDGTTQTDGHRAYAGCPQLCCYRLTCLVTHKAQKYTQGHFLVKTKDRTIGKGRRRTWKAALAHSWTLGRRQFPYEAIYTQCKHWGFLFISSTILTVLTSEGQLCMSWPQPATQRAPPQLNFTSEGSKSWGHFGKTERTLNSWPADAFCPLIGECSLVTLACNK